MSNKPNRYLSYKSAIIPVALGVLVSLYFIISNVKSEHFETLVWCRQCYIWVVFALLMLVARQLAYMARIKILTGDEISWKRSFYIILLWEFASSVTPTLVGGTAVALFILSKEGVRLGKTTSVVLLTAMFDEIFYLIAAPLFILVAGNRIIFPSSGQVFNIFGYMAGAREVFYAGYIFLFLFTFLVFYGIFINPRGFKVLIMGVFSLPLVKKWKHKGKETAEDVVITSREMRNKPFSFWLKIFVATSFAWIARFALVNFIILAVSIQTDQLLVFTRQIVLWIIMLISPTPGGSGIAEITFSLFMKDLIPNGLSHVLSLAWRMLSYYPYIIAGLIVLPGWIRRVYSKSK